MADVKYGKASQRVQPLKLGIYFLIQNIFINSRYFQLIYNCLYALINLAVKDKNVWFIIMPRNIYIQFHMCGVAAPELRGKIAIVN